MTKADIEFKTRRAVMAGLLGAVGSAAAAAPAAKLGISRGSGGVRVTAASLKHGDLAAWQSAAGGTFLLAGENGPCLVKLVSVRPLGGTGERPGACTRRQGFAAQFETAAAATPAGDATYRIAHPSHGAFPIFLAAATREGSRARLVAIFN